MDNANPVSAVLVHGQVTIIFVVSVCLSVCLFVCAEFFSAVFDPISIKVGHSLGLVVSPRIQGLCDPWGLGDPRKTCIFRGFGAAVNHIAQPLVIFKNYVTVCQSSISNRQQTTDDIPCCSTEMSTLALDQHYKSTTQTSMQKRLFYIFV